MFLDKITVLYYSNIKSSVNYLTELARSGLSPDAESWQGSSSRPAKTVTTTQAEALAYDLYCPC